ncbi:DUF4097 domain-containing protein [Bacillus sp. H-16]|uniref:DUF4097 family beta strand repeat-containing protein n=1 Tax=Alteribacter salitolerans TaxID=2912333 RepID=UPI0019656806|nr:DUF4097 domain-containing protein [Alteribacter salitolerans]MBM7096891.1 DUF4097 domain-containing protein [Alteribacter salitolerans]
MQEERKMILKMIEDGKITAEEGLQLLNALKDDKTDPSDDGSGAGPQSNHEISTEVNWEKGEEYRNRASSRQPSFASRFTDFIEDAVHKIKEFDLDFNFGSSVEIQHTYQHTGAVIADVDVSVENGSVTFRPWEESDIRIECSVKVYKVRDADEARRFFLDEVIFDVKEKKLRLKSPSKSMKVNTVIYLPAAALERIKLYAFNGKISGETIDTISFEAQTVNGRIGFEQVTGKDVRLETVNGTISVEKLSAGHCDAKTVNGTIDLNVAKGEVDVETLNGTINYTLIENEGTRAYFKTTTGSVVVRVPEEMKVEGELKTTVGGINCELPMLTIIDEKKDWANKRMSFLANKEAETSMYVEAEATTGSITVKN